jgi:hypothetical protein
VIPSGLVHVQACIASETALKIRFAPMETIPQNVTIKKIDYTFSQKLYTDLMPMRYYQILWTHAEWHEPLRVPTSFDIHDLLFCEGAI